jgi:hypothetical protein
VQTGPNPVAALNEVGFHAKAQLVAFLNSL